MAAASTILRIGARGRSRSERAGQGFTAPPVPLYHVISRAREREARADAQDEEGRIPIVNSRRDFLIGAAAPLLLAWPARAASFCAPVKAMKGANVCRAYLDSFKASQETDQASHDPRAIWVACVAVVFAMYDHIVPQARIMAEGYGGLDKVPVVASIAVAAPLMRIWKDEEGVDFRASFEPMFDDAVGGALDAKPLFAAIDHGDPLILICNDHPVVLMGIAYAEDRPERPIAGFILDPKPMVGRRPAARDQLLPNSAGGDLLLAVRTKLEKV